MRGLFEFIVGMLIILWWVLKIIAFIVFIVMLVAVLGALFNNNAPAGSDIAWLIVSFIAIFIL